MLDDEGSTFLNELLLLREEIGLYRSGQQCGTDLRAVLEQLSYSVCICTHAGRIVYANDAFASLHDCRRRECIGRELSSFHRPDQREMLRDLLAGVLEFRKPSSVLLWNLKKDGTPFPVLSSIFLHPDVARRRSYVVVLSVESAEGQAGRSESPPATGPQGAVEETLGLGYFTIDIARNAVTWSEQACRIYGRTDFSAAMTAMDMRAMTFPDDHAFVRTQMERCIREGEMVDFVHRIVRPDGEVRWVRCIAKGALCPQGASPVMQGLVLDVTSQGPPGDAAAAGDLPRILEEAPLPCLTLDPRGRIREVNLQWREMLGLARDEFIGRHLAAFIDAESANRFQAELLRLTETGEKFRLPLRLIMTGGRIVPATIECVADVDGAGTLRNVVCFFSPTQGHGLPREEQPREGQPHLLGLWEYDVATGRVSSSDEVYELLGKDRASGPVQLTELAALLDIPAADLLAVIQKTLKTEERFVREFATRPPGGELKWFRLTACAGRGEAGRITKISGVLEDISGRIALERELADCDARLRQQIKELEQKNVTLRELIRQLQGSEEAIGMQVQEIIRRSVLSSLRGAKKRNPREREPAVLTPRELEICEMIRSGRSSKEIAKELSISAQSVQTHRHNIRRKLGLLNQRMNLEVYLRKHRDGSETSGT